MLIGGGVATAIATQLLAQTAPLPTPTVAATASAPAGTPAENAVTTYEIVWAREVDPATNEPARKATAFITTDAAIYATLPVSQVAAGSVVEATWTYNDIPVPALTTSVTLDHGYQSGWVAFHITLPQGQIWPTGEYAITIAINGQTVAESSVKVTVPPS